MTKCVDDKGNYELFPDVAEEVNCNLQRERENFIDSLPYFDNPKNDNEILLNLQKNYLKTKNKKYEAELWERCLIIAEKLIKKERHEKRFFLDYDSLQDKKMDAVLYMLRRYQKRYKGKNKYWAVHKSFLSAIQYACEHALYYTKEPPVIYVEDIKQLSFIMEDTNEN